MKKQTLLAAALALFISIALVGCNSDAQPNFDYTPTSPTAGETITFNNRTINGDTYEWDFGDGNTSTAKNPTHAYDSIGTYKVTLSAQPKNGNAPSIFARNIEVN